MKSQEEEKFPKDETINTSCAETKSRGTLATTDDAQSGIYQYNVMVIGGNRCGKTSVIAAMQGCFADYLRPFDLAITAINSAQVKELRNKCDEVRKYLNRSSAGVASRFVPDDTPTLDIYDFPTNIKINGKERSKAILNFIDYPGQWLGDRERQDELLSIMHSANAIIVVIDTPFLMEESMSVGGIGAYNELRNRSSRIVQMLKQVAADGKERLVLFVPVKCERYCTQEEGKKPQFAKALYQKVKLAYKNALLDLTEPPHNKLYTIGIVPIITAGDLRFTRFERNRRGDVVLGSDGIPQLPLYQIVGEQKYSPCYQEVPLLLILLHLLLLMRNFHYEQTSSTWYGAVLKFLGIGGKEPTQILNAEEHLEQVEAIIEQLTNYDNIFYVQDPLGIHGDGQIEKRTI